MPWKVEQGHGCPASRPWAVVKTTTGERVACHPTKASAQQQVKALYAKEGQMSAASADCGCSAHDDTRAVDNSAWDGDAAMSRCSSSNTPASCFNSICAARVSANPADTQAGWALPHHKSPGSPPNAKGVSSALGYLNRTQGIDKAAARRHLEAHMASVNAGNNSAPQDGEYRSFRFDLERTDGNGDGLTFEGYAAVFNSPTRVDSLWEGTFDEVIKRGAFARTLAERSPKLMFEHGRHPLVGQMPLGVIQDAREDAKGLFIRARLSDNWLIQPVRDAVRDGAVDGMSFRFSVPEGGDQWKDRKGQPKLRTLLDIDVPELGPVVFPAYEPTTASVRSLVERLDDFTGRPDARSAGGGDAGSLQRAQHDAEPGNGTASPQQARPSGPSAAARARDRVLRLERIIR